MGKADDPFHNRNHKRVRRHKGSASEYTCECGRGAEEWAQTHDTDGSLDEHFRLLCRKCHKAYDYDLNWGPEQRAKRSEALIGKGGGPRTEEAKARMRLAHTNCKCPSHQNKADTNA